MGLFNRYPFTKYTCLALCGITLAGAAFLSGCQLTEDTDKADVPHESVEGVPDRLTAAEDIIVDFTKSGDQGFWSANGYKNGDPFNCTWSNSCTVVEDGIMNMSVKKEGNTYYGAEYRSRASYSYGYYSVCMKAADCSGVISSFFTYTNNPWWDEIDIEILGKNMTEVQFNYYTMGRRQSRIPA